MRSKKLLEELLSFHETHEITRKKTEWMYQPQTEVYSEISSDLDDIKAGFQKFLRMSNIGEKAVDLVL
jgi:hypothetical protein